jgi:hypothetical protein
MQITALVMDIVTASLKPVVAFSVLFDSFELFFTLQSLICYVMICMTWFDVCKSSRVIICTDSNNRHPIFHFPKLSTYLGGK